MRCNFEACPCRAGCWHLTRAHRLSCNPKLPEDVRNAYAGGLPVLVQKRLDQPLRWKKPRRIGVQFMGDMFDNQVPYSWQLQVFKKGIEASIQHQFFFLTKQVGNMKDAVLNTFRDRQRMIPMNFYWGISVTDQEDADRMLPELLRIPGRHWVSVEPMLGPVDFSYNRFCGKMGWGPPDPPRKNGDHVERLRTQSKWVLSKISLVVLGCESGKNRRPCPIEWMVDVVQQCKAAGVPVWVKQLLMPRFHAGYGECVYDVVHDINLFPKELQVRQRP